MKVATASVFLASLAPLATAFPRAIFDNATPEILERARSILAERQSGVDAVTAANEPVNTFNEKKQFISINGSHAYVAPGSGDQRGPCPGLNAFANHGYLPHNGVATIGQYIQATEQVTGMGAGLAIFLSTYGAVIDGSGTSWSLGGTPSGGRSQGNGISNSHNKYESDASPTRPDLYEAGNDYMTVASQFQDLVNACPGSVTMSCLTNFRSQRFKEQIANNPYFFNGPFTGVLVQPAAYTFIFRFMANHSSENPQGYLSYDVLASWFGMTGSNGNYKANQGQEKIPANWYRRAFEYPYDNTYFLADVAAAAAQYPQFLSVGGNTGTKNSFSGVDVTNLTGGVYNSQTLLQKNNFACFAYQFAAQAKPDVALGLLSKLTGLLGSVTSGLSCPQLRNFDNAQLNKFPGYSRSPASA